MDYEKINELIAEINKLYIPQEPGKQKKYKLPNFHKLYLYTNEELSEYFPKIIVKNGDVLTVGSSGDQILYALLCGAKSVTCFDVNPFTKFYFDYKVAAIKNLEFEEFSKAFNGAYSDDVLTLKTYKKISHDLPEDSKYFWDNLFLENDTLDYIDNSTILGHNHYIEDKKQFEKIKSRLKKPYSVDIINCDLAHIYNRVKNKKFDNIFLSNIYDYALSWKFRSAENASLTFGFDSIKKHHPFHRYTSNLLTLLKPNGKMQVEIIFSKNSNSSYYEEGFQKIHKNYKIYTVPTSDCQAIIIENNEKTNENEPSF